MPTYNKSYTVDLKIHYSDGEKLPGQLIPTQINTLSALTHSKKGVILIFVFVTRIRVYFYPVPCITIEMTLYLSFGMNAMDAKPGFFTSA